MRGIKKVAAIIAEHGHVDIRSHRSLRTTVGRMVKNGILTRLLPSIYIATKQKSNLSILVAAFFAWAPDAVLIGDSANSIHSGQPPRLPLTVALTSTRSAPRWIQITRRRLSPESIRTRGRVRYAAQLWLAVDSAAKDEGKALYEVLRDGADTLHHLPVVLSEFRGANGNSTRNRLVAQGQLNPHSYAENQLQQLLLSNGITEWVANYPFWTDGHKDIADIYLPEVALVAEFDSWEYHRSRESFERDRAKQLRLLTKGIATIRITWSMLCDDPAALIRLIKTAIKFRGNALPSP